MVDVDGKSRALELSVDSRSTRDYSGQWFQILEEEGEDVGIGVGVVFGDGRVSWFSRSHRFFDGLGAVADVCAALDVDAGLPTSRVRCPSRLRSLLTAARFSLDVPRHIDWWPRTTPAMTATKATTAQTLLDEAGTAAVVDAARGSGVSVGALLLQRLSTAVAPLLTTPHDAQPWMLPVNLRGHVRAPRPTQNQVGFFTVETKAAQAPTTITQKLAACEDAGEAHATWMLNQIGRVVGLSGVRVALNAARRQGYKNVGNFSNLGILELKPRSSLVQGDVRGIYFLPPVARSQSFAVGVVTVAGRLSVSAVLHPTVAVSAAALQSVVDRCVEPA